MLEGVLEGFGPIGAVAAAGLVLAAVARGRIRWGWFAAAMATLVVYELALTSVYGRLPLPALGETWNWTGKLLAVATTLLIASLPWVGWRRSGLTLRQDSKGARGALILSAALAALFLGLAIYFPGESWDAEHLAFQLTMPGLDEELLYRGVLLLMFNEAFGRPVRVLGAPMGWGAVLTSLTFGLVHALGFEDGGYTFDAVAMAATGVSALLLVWLREKTGSVLLPVVMHNYGNAIFLLI